MTSISNGITNKETTLNAIELNNELCCEEANINMGKNNQDSDPDNKLAQLYQAAKDENELLEFKNYELLFKIQELEQNQRKILSKLVITDSNLDIKLEKNCLEDDDDDHDKSNFEIRNDRQSKSKHDHKNHDNYLKSHTKQQLQHLGGSEALGLLQAGEAEGMETLLATRKTPTTNSSSDLAVKKKSSDLLLSIAEQSANNGLIDGTIQRASKINNCYKDIDQGEGEGEGKEEEEEEEKGEMLMMMNTKKVGQQVALAAKWNQRQRQQANLKLSGSIHFDFNDESCQRSNATASVASATATCLPDARSEEPVSRKLELPNNKNGSNSLLQADTQLSALLQASPECNRNGSREDDNNAASMLKLNATDPQQSEKSSANHLGHENMNQQMEIDYSLGARKTNKRQICGLHDMTPETDSGQKQITKPFLGSPETFEISDTATGAGAENATSTSLVIAADFASMSQQKKQQQQVICGNSMASMNLDEVQKLIEYNACQKRSFEHQQKVVTLQSCKSLVGKLEALQLPQQVGGSNELQQRQAILTSSSKPTKAKTKTKVMMISESNNNTNKDEVTTTMDKTNDGDDNHNDAVDADADFEVEVKAQVRVSKPDNELNNSYSTNSNWNYNFNKSHTDDETINDNANGLYIDHYTSFSQPLTGYDLNDELQQIFMMSEKLSESLPNDQSYVSRELNEQQQDQHLQKDQKTFLKQNSSKMPTIKAAKSSLNEEAKKLAASQPNLVTTQQVGPQAAVRRSTGNARIAVPVARKIPSILSGGKQQQQQQQQPLSLPVNKPICSSSLRFRSKSNFDQSSLLKRNSNLKQQQAKQVSRASSISNVKSATISNNHESSFYGVVVEEKQQQASNLTANKSPPSALPSVCPLRARNRSRSSSSIGFVTQIPTLISQSHAQALGAPPTSEIGAANCKRKAIRPPGSVSATTMTTALGVSAEAAMAPVEAGKKAASGHSKSMSNLAISSNFRCSTTATTKQQQIAKTENCNELTNQILDPTARRKSDDYDQDTLHKMGDKATRCLKTTRSLLPKAPKGKSLSLHCMSMINYDDDGLARQRDDDNDGGYDDDDHDDVDVDVDVDHRKDLMSEKAPMAICVVNEQQEREENSEDGGEEAKGTSCEPLAKASQDGNNSLLNSLLTNQKDCHTNNDGNKNNWVKQQHCAQCKLLQSKVNLLIKDRKQLNEQINELEEMENDSRLMSQKLSQQLQLVEQQLEQCKLELHKTCDSESKLQFQNKRLNLELQERFESIEKLQGQLNKLKIEHENSKSFSRHFADQVCPSCCNNSGNNNNNNNGKANNNNNGIDLTRNNDESSSSSSSSSSLASTTAQSELHLKGNNPASLPEAKQQVLQQQQQQKLPTSNKQQTDRSPALSMSNSDDDSAIDMFEKASLANSVPVSLDTEQRRFLDEGIKSTDLKNNEKIKRTSLCDDSAYSKSSASSDANSDDGHRSDYEQVEDSARETEKSSVSVENVGSKVREQSVELIAGKTKRVELNNNNNSDGKGNNNLHTSIASSLSSGDESDHHERGSSPITPINGSIHQQKQQQIEQQSVQQQSNKEFATSNQQQQAQTQIVASSSSSALTSRQQVLRKKISTARILRGIQVQQQQQQQQQTRSASPTNKIKDCYRAIERPSTICAALNETPSSLSSSSSSLFKSTVGQARFAQVVLPESIDRSVAETTTTTTTTTTTITTTITGCETKKEQQQNTIQETANDQCESPIDLALKGVEQLERGLRTDEALKSLIGRDSRKNIQIISGGENGTNKMSKNGDSSGNNLVQSSNLINQFKLEIASLKMRLFQAHTLNDNLVSELKSNKDRLDQLVGQLSSSQHAMSRERQQVEHHKQQQVELEPLRRRSIVYVNGFQATQQPIQGTQQRMNNTNNNCCLQSSPDNHQCNGFQRTACVSQSELLDFLRFLLDKVHFHHGRTFELVNECQKLAMNALLASYSHQMNLVHHNSAIMAGNQAIKRVAMPPEVSGHHQYFQQAQPQPHPQQQQQQQQQQHFQQQPVVEVYPIRPPPRRRNATNRTMPEEHHQLDSVSDQQQQQQAANIGSKLTQLDPQANNNQSSTSALQVAKRTLFSIVPIYYNSNSNNNGNNNSGNGNSNVNICNNNNTTSNTNLKEANNSKNFAIKQSNKEINKQQSYESLNLDNLKNENNNNKLGNGRLSNILSSPSSSIKRLHAKSKSWIVLNSSKTNKGQQTETYYANLDANRHQQQQQQQQPQENVSVLEINRTTMSTSAQNVSRILPDDQQHHSQAHSLVEPLLQQPALASSQNLFKAKNSLSEDIERYRIRFNGQLLDLLTRQNWCESIISEKIRIYQSIEQQQLKQHHQSCQTVFTSSESHIHLVTSESKSAKNIYSMANKQSRSVPTIVSSVSLNPNGSTVSHQQYQSHLRSRLNQDQQSSSSFC